MTRLCLKWIRRRLQIIRIIGTFFAKSKGLDQFIGIYDMYDEHALQYSTV